MAKIYQNRGGTLTPVLDTSKFVDIESDQLNIAGNKTFINTINVPDSAADDDSSRAANTKFVRTALDKIAASFEATLEITSRMESNSNIVLPSPLKYIVGSKQLTVFYNGVILYRGMQYTENGMAGSESTSITILHELIPGDILLFRIAGLADTSSMASEIHGFGNETIGGIKTFLNSPVVPNLPITDNSQNAANTKFVHDAISGFTTCYDEVLDISSFISAGSQVTLPAGVQYIVGSHMLMVSYDGAVCHLGKQFEEVGTVGEISSKIKIRFDLTPGDQLGFRIHGLSNTSEILSPQINGLLSCYDEILNIDTAIEPETDITLPAGLKYMVGSHMLMMSYNGSVCHVGEQFDEVGTVGAISSKIKIHFDLIPGDQLGFRIHGLSDTNGIITAKNVDYGLYDVINVKDYGARGDGLNDDRTAIQNAITAAASSGKTLFLPSGTYLISKMLDFYSNVSIVGENKHSIIKRAYDRWYDSSNNPHTLMVRLYPMPGDSVNYVHDIYIDGITFDAQGATYDGIPLDVIAVGGTKVVNLEVSHCKFLDVYEDHALDLSLVENAHIHHCEFLGWKPSPTTEIKYREAIQFDMGDASKDDERTKNVVIEYCVFRESNNLGCWKRAIGNHGYADSDIHHVFENVVIRNNLFYGDNETTSPMINLYIFDNVIIEGNVFKKCPTVLGIGARSVAPNPPDGIGSASNNGIVFSRNYVNGNYSNNNKNGVVVDINGWKESSNLEHLPDTHIVISENRIEDVYMVVYVREDSGAKGLYIKNNSVKNCFCTGKISGFLHAGVLSENCFTNCGNFLCPQLSTSTQYSDPMGARRSLIISDNTWFDLPENQRAVIVQNMDGLIIKNNIIYENHQTRTQNFIEVNWYTIGARGIIIKDNVIFASSTNIGRFIYSTASAAVIEGNLCYVNGELVEQ